MPPQEACQFRGVKRCLNGEQRRRHFSHGMTRRHLIQTRSRTRLRRGPDGTVVTTACIRHCSGGDFTSGVLWAVKVRTFKKDGVDLRAAKRWIACDLLRYDGHGWKYTALKEADSLGVYSCPLGYLDLVPIVSEVWRDGVQDYHID